MAALRSKYMWCGVTSRNAFFAPKQAIVDFVLQPHPGGRQPRGMCCMVSLVQDGSVEVQRCGHFSLPGQKVRVML